ncbi:MAG: hypothetical protein F9K45_11325 [Melioribacteraceae bacterium]|nr:MAG: hypothetical protein F9K45_11325 [Melioribacteraceae bacterium]
MKRKLNTAAFFISLAVSVLSTYSMAGRVRTVDIITLFCGGMMAGISIVNFIRMKKEKTQ